MRRRTALAGAGSLLAAPLRAREAELRRLQELVRVSGARVE